MPSDDLMRMRMQLAYAPRWVSVTHATFHRGMADHWREHLFDLSRPPYDEAPGFADDRRSLRPGWSPRRRSIAGHEKPYAWTRPYWRTFWLFVKHDTLAGWYESKPDGGGEHHRYNGNYNQFALVTGLTS